MYKQRGGDIESDPVVVYGVWDRDDNFDEMLDSDWINTNFRDMSTFFAGVGDGGYGVPIYGYELNLDKGTGQVTKPDDNKKQNVAKLHSILLQHHQRKGSRKLPQIGYYAAIDDINGELDRTYTPGENVNSSSGSGSNNNDSNNNYNSSGGGRRKGKGKRSKTYVARIKGGKRKTRKH